MRVQKFVVEITTGDKDGCGNPIPSLTEGNVRIALSRELEAEDISVAEIVDNR